MVKYLALAVAVVVSLVAVDMAQAGRLAARAVVVAPVGFAMSKAYGPATARVRWPRLPRHECPARCGRGCRCSRRQPAPQYYTSARRGLFGWRR